MTTERTTVDHTDARQAWRPSPALWLFALLLLALAPRLLLVRRHALWVDEVFSLAVATGHSLEHPAAAADPALHDYVEPEAPAVAGDFAKYARHDSPPAGLARVVRAVRLSDTSPPLYYLVLYGWTRVLGASDAALRWLSLIAALACIPPLWATARLLGGTRSAVAACAVFAVLPLSVYLSTEGRMYSLVWLAASTNSWASVRLSRRGRDPLAAVAWVSSGVAGLLTHYFFVFVWLAAIVWLLVCPSRAPRSATAALVLITCVVVAPWYVQLPAQIASVRLTDGWLSWPPPNYHPLRFYLLMPYHFFAASGPWSTWKPLDHAFLVVWAALAAAALAWRRGARHLSRWALPVLSLAGAVGGVAAFDLWKHTYAGAVERYVAGGLPAAALLAGLALGRLALPARAVFLILLALQGMVGFRRMHMNDGRHDQPLDQVAGWLAQQAGPSDLVIVHSIPSGVIGLSRYLETAHIAASGQPTIVSWVEQLGRRRVPEDIQRLAEGRAHVFLVRVHEAGAAAPLEAWLREHAGQLTRERWEAITVEEFEGRGAPEMVASPANRRPGS